jgi:hypothetical protein
MGDFSGALACFSAKMQERFGESGFVLLPGGEAALGSAGLHLECRSH